MSEQYPGGYITKSPVVPTSSAAPGIWSLNQQAAYQAAGTWPGVLLPDAQFNYVTMLLHGDGTNGAQNNTFLDSSASPLTITRVSNATQGSFSPYGSNWSTNFVPAAGLGDQLTVGNATDLQFGTGDFTFECWVNTAGYSNYQTIYDKGYGASGSFLIQMNTDYKPFVYSSGGFLLTSSTAFVVGTWNHFAVVRSGSTMTMYINGTSVGSVSNSTNFNDASNIAVGARYLDRTYPWSGYISNLRLVKGTAVYTSAFTPPTAPLTAISGTSLLISQSNRFIDNSANNYTVAPVNVPSVQRFNPFGTSTAYSTATLGGSFYSTTGGYIYATDSSFAVGTGDFTVEGWVYNNSASYVDIMGSSNTGTSPNGIAVRSTEVFIGAGSSADSLSITTPLKQWYYFALCRTGTDVRWYLNGNYVASFTSSRNISKTEMDIGAIYTNAIGGYTDAYFCDMQFSNTAKYTGSTLTVPTSPVTAGASTKLLCNMTNGAIYDNAMMNDLQTVGNAQISTSVVKYGTGSLYFDGTGDWLTVPTSQNFAPGVGDWTIECWLYPISGNWAIVAGSNFYINNNSGTVYVGDASVDIITASPPSTGVWTHIAVTKSGSTVRLFYDGTQVGSSTTALSTAITTSMVVGGRPSSSISTNGYIDDLRITKGYARYTTAFTPPTAAFSNTGPT